MMKKSGDTDPAAAGHEPRWVALYTRSRHEKKVETQLIEKKLAVYVPMKRVLKQWSDRKKWVEEPLFRSYVFVKGTAQERYRAVQSIGVVRMVTFNGQLAFVRDEEIEMIRRILADAPDTDACPVSFRVGDTVEIETGPLAGLKGKLEEIRGETRFLVSIASISQGIHFNVDKWNIRKING
jgi:transcriptional antiterminator RfaH